MDDNNVLLDDSKPVRDDQQNTGDICFHIALHRRARTYFRVRLMTNQSSVMSVANIRNAAGETIQDVGNDLTVTTIINHEETTYTLADFIDALSLPSINISNIECYISAKRYLEFDICFHNKVNLKALWTPTFHSRWDMSQLVGCIYMERLHVRGVVCINIDGDTGEEVFHTQYLSGLNALEHLWFECDPDVLIDLSHLSSLPLRGFCVMLREYSLPKGESYVLDVDKILQFPSSCPLETFTSKGNYSFPLRGVRGSLDSFLAFLPTMKKIVLDHNSTTPTQAGKSTYLSDHNINNNNLEFSVVNNLDSSIYQNLPSNE